MEPEPGPRERRRPWGVTIVGVFYAVLGAHALFFGFYFLTLTPGTSPSVPFAAFLEADPGFVRAYGYAMLGFAMAFLVNAVALFQDRWWARWSTSAMAPLHLIGPPFLYGGMLFALAVNLYLWGSGRARSFFEGRRAAARA